MPDTSDYLAVGNAFDRGAATAMEFNNQLRQQRQQQFQNQLATQQNQRAQQQADQQQQTQAFDLQKQKADVANDLQQRAATNAVNILHLPLEIRKSAVAQSIDALAPQMRLIGEDPDAAKQRLDAMSDDELNSELQAHAAQAPKQTPVSVAPGASLVNPTTGQPVYTAPAGVDYKDAGDKLVPVDRVSGQPRADMAPIPKKMTAFQQQSVAPPSGSQLDIAYQYFKTNGSLPPGMTPRNDAGKKALWDYIGRKAQEEGLSTVQAIANGQATKAAGDVLKDFAKGKTSQTLNGLNTAITHMDQLDKAADALDNGDVRVLNSMSNFFGRQLGGSAVTNFNVVKNFAAGEVSKAVLPGGGGEMERKEIADEINSSNSPQQLKQAIQTWRNLLAGKTEALRNQWDVGTGGTQGEFDRFLLPATKRALGIGDTTQGGPQSGPQGGQLPPPQALSQLKEGIHTTFGNGQVWTLQNGKPARVQ